MSNRSRGLFGTERTLPRSHEDTNKRILMSIFKSDDAGRDRPLMAGPASRRVAGDASTRSESDAEMHGESDRRLAAAGGVLLKSDRNDAFDEVRQSADRKSAIQERREAPRRFADVERHADAAGK